MYEDFIPELLLDIPISIRGQDTVLLIDGDIFMYKCSSPKQINGEVVEEDTLELAISKFNNWLKTLINNTKSNNYIGFLTGKSNYRYSIYPEYKANRKGKPKPQHLSALRDYAINQYGFIVSEGVEADDMLAIAHTVLINSEYKPIIVTSDKDLSTNPCTIYNLFKDEYNEVSEYHAWYKLNYQLVVGDTVDNVKGISGKGEKAALAILTDTSLSDWTSSIIKEYISVYKEEGLKEYWKNFQLLRIINTPSEYKSITGNNYPNIINLIKQLNIE